MHAKKKWGQNFLRNRGAAEQIVAAVEPAPDEVILEIGPGEGVLTEGLVALGRPVEAVEIDPDLAERLRTRFGDKVKIVEGDAVHTLLPGGPYRAVGNLPYNVGTAIVRRVVADPNFRRAVFMLQKEVVDRITAKPGDDDYGYLTLAVQLYATARVIIQLGPKSFHPAPKVRSSVVVLDPKPRDYEADADELEPLVSTAFRMRRKKLVNNLIGWAGLDRDAAAAAIEEAGIEAGVRGEELSLADFDRLALALRSRKA